MSLARTCARCAAPLTDDAPEGAVCTDCLAALESEQTMATPADGTASPSYRLPTETPRTEVIGDFEILGKLGQGGMGAVYRARQVSLDRTVALKVLPEYFAADEENVARFQREARIASGLIHGNIVHVYSSGVVDGTHYIAMELVEGENLRQRMKREPLSMSEALHICAEIARGLQYGWEHAHLVHRDIKPGNIFLSAKGEVKVGDLGLAKSVSGVTSGLTQTGTSLGTALYMSPEQVRGDKTFDFRSDIYSLGCTLYEMLTGHPPYSGADGMTVMNMHVNAPIPAILKALPGCPMPLVRLVGKMLRKHARERHASYVDLIAEIEMVREQIESGATHAGPSKVVEAWKQVGDIEAAPATSYGLLWVGLALLLLVGAGIGWWAMQPPKPRSTSTTPARSSPLVGTLTPATPAPTTAGEPPALPAATTSRTWENLLLRDPAKLYTHAGAALNRNEILLVGDSHALVREIKRNAAIRMRAIFGVSRLLLIARDRDGSFYNITVTNDRTLALARWEQTGRKSHLLNSFTLPAPLLPGQEFDLELRIIGDRLTGFFNGEKAVSATDATIAEGTFGVRRRDLLASDGGSTPASVKSLEFLDLDGVPEAEALKLANGSSSPAPQGSSTAANERPSPLIFGGHRYQLIHQAETWSNARKKAEEMGGHLAVVTSAAENDFLLGTLKKVFPTEDRILVWIGAASEDRSGRFKWITGEPMQFTGWGAAEPDEHLQPSKSPPYGAFYARDTHYNLPEFAWADGPSDGAKRYFVEWEDAGSASAAPAAATKDAPFVNSLGMKFVPVPITGGPTDGQRVLFSVWETRVQDYEVFAKETKREWPKADFEQGPTHPAVNITRPDAEAFCAWLTDRERKAGRVSIAESYRLPNDHEWSCAVGIGDREDATRPMTEKTNVGGAYPWGSVFPLPPGAGNYKGAEAVGSKAFSDLAPMTNYRDDYPETAPVGSFAANVLGLFDLGGNVWEWCGDSINDGRGVVRGAAFANGGPTSLFFSSKRNFRLTTTQDQSFGFRAVLAPAP